MSRLLKITLTIFIPTNIVFASTAILNFVGDCTLGDLNDRKENNCLSAYYEKYGAAYFTQYVKPIFETSDLTIANCEGVFCDLPATSKYRLEKAGKRNFWPKGDPDLATIFKEGGINIVNVANNHTFDYKDQGYDETIQTLEDLGIDYFGNDYFFVTDVNFITIGFFGLRLGMASLASIKSQIENLKNNYGCDIIVATFHGGIERTYEPIKEQINAAKIAIDNGADIVIQHHPHVLQQISYYSDRPIAYSLGNFIFGANRNPEDKRSIIFQVHINQGEYNNFSFTHKIIPVRISGKTNYNNFQPIDLTGTAEGDEIIELVTDETSAIYLEDSSLSVFDSY